MGAGLKATSLTSLVSLALPPAGLRGPQRGPRSEGSIRGDRSCPSELEMLFPVLSGSFGASSPAHPSSLLPNKSPHFLGPVVPWETWQMLTLLLILIHFGPRSVAPNSPSEIYSPSGLRGGISSVAAGWFLIMDSWSQPWGWESPSILTVEPVLPIGFWEGRSAELRTIRLSEVNLNSCLLLGAREMLPDSS